MMMTMEREYLAVEYKAMLPLLIEAIHELEGLAISKKEHKRELFESIRDKIAKLQADLKKLKERISHVDKQFGTDEDKVKRNA